MQVPVAVDTSMEGAPRDTGQSLAVWAESLYLVNLLLALVSALLLLSPGMGLSQNQTPPSPESSHERDLVRPVNYADRTESPANSSGRSSRLNWETREGRSYLIPAAEILAYLLLLNQFDRHFTEQMSDYLLTGAVQNALNMPSVTAEDADAV